MRSFTFVFSTANCYNRVMQETKVMNDKIHDKLGLNPDDKEVVVLYDGEKDKVIWRLLIVFGILFGLTVFDVVFFCSRRNFGKESELLKWKSHVQFGSTRICCRKRHNNQPKRPKSNQPIWANFTCHQCLLN